jgi:predicted nucleic acid-binding Zn ribbon protein
VRTLPDPIGDEVRRELNRFGPAGRMGEIVAAWPGAVGPAIAANAWPARVSRDGTLHVNAASSTWAFELTQLSSSVLERLREQLGGDYPSALRFAAGPLPEAGEDVEKLRDRTVPSPTTEQLDRSSEIAAPIADPGLREAVARAAAASFALGSRPSDDRSV